MNNNSIEKTFKLCLHLDKFYNLQITDEIHTIIESIKKMMNKQIKPNCIDFLIDKGESRFELNISRGNIVQTKKSNMIIYNHCGRNHCMLLRNFSLYHGESRTNENVVCFYWKDQILH